MDNSSSKSDVYLTQPLTQRENEILSLFATGKSNRAIADQLSLALSTVKWYARQLYRGRVQTDHIVQIDHMVSCPMLATLPVESKLAIDPIRCRFNLGQWVFFFMLKQLVVPTTPLDIGFLGVFPPLYHQVIVPEIGKGTIFLMGITSLGTAKANIYGHLGSASLRNPNSASSPNGSNVSTHSHAGWGCTSWRRTPMPTAEKNEIINVASPNIHRNLVISRLAKATHVICTTTTHICAMFAGITRIVSPSLRISLTGCFITIRAKMHLATPR
jgi:hypothetical protein